ncbi:hypothetical protein AK830_g11864 [Neonectria ditissima]|uniref:Uncharacterized protein n=1 Tax=Neonectria ditissima TaxID=78410 RepID=A0A0N8H4Z0_9HYPO|nr:hypothetical protein AK830_g11864 [Neonectria ditissima]
MNQHDLSDPIDTNILWDKKQPLPIRPGHDQTYDILEPSARYGEASAHHLEPKRLMDNRHSTNGEVWDRNDVELKRLYPARGNEGYNLDGEAPGGIRTPTEHATVQEDLRRVEELTSGTEPENEDVPELDVIPAGSEEEAKSGQNSHSTGQRNLTRSHSDTTLRALRTPDEVPGVPSNRVRRVNRRLFGMLRRDVRRRVEEAEVAREHDNLGQYGISTRDFAFAADGANLSEGVDEDDVSGSEEAPEPPNNTENVEDDVEETSEPPERP